MKRCPAPTRLTFKTEPACALKGPGQRRHPLSVPTLAMSGYAAAGEVTGDPEG